jgi:MarR family 2-MHQ and catechol resistance regulon transcriptional repressor
MKKAARCSSPRPAEGGAFSSVREFMQRTTPEGEAKSPEEIPLPPAIMCHLFLLSCVLERTANREAERHGLTLPQWMALGCIGNEGKIGITHSDLCGRLMLSKAPVTGIVDRLVRDGYVVRRSDARDRRVSRIAIKPRGEAAWRRVRDALRDHAATHCRGLSASEQGALFGLLSRLLEDVSQADKQTEE